MEGVRNFLECIDKISYCKSEPDTGIYNAMNKGVKVPKGEYLFFLNSVDDFVNNYALEKIVTHLTREDIVYFNINQH